MVPVVEGIELLLGFGFGLRSDLKLEAVRQMRLGGDVGKQMGDVGELWSFGAKTADQFDGDFGFYCFRHDCNDCREAGSALEL